MSVQSQALVSDAAHLSQTLENQVSTLQRTNILVIAGLIGLFLIYFIFNYFMTQRRALNGLARIQTGTDIVGTGNLDFKIEYKGKDEIADLSRAFNRMSSDLKTANLSAVTERQRLYNVLETLPVYVILLDKDYHVPFANKFFRERFGEFPWKVLL